MTDWRDNLSSFFDKAEQEKQVKETSELARFIAGVVVPAFRELSAELEKHGRTVTIREAEESAAIIVLYNGEEEITYRVHGRTFPNGVLPYAEVRFRERKGLKFIRVEGMLRSGSPDYAMQDVTGDEIVENFLQHYTSRVRGE